MDVVRVRPRAPRKRCKDQLRRVGAGASGQQCGVPFSSSRYPASSPRPCLRDDAPYASKKRPSLEFPNARFLGPIFSIRRQSKQNSHDNVVTTCFTIYLQDGYHREMGGLMPDGVASWCVSTPFSSAIRGCTRPSQQTHDHHPLTSFQRNPNTSSYPSLHTL